MAPFDPTWEEVYQNTGFGGGYPDLELVRFVARNLYSKDRASTRILEVGCGVGANLWYLAREGFDVTGLDGSATAIKKCSERFKTQNLKGHLVVGDACALDFPDHYFDAVADIECIYANTLSDIRKILGEIHRVLKPGGHFFSMMFATETHGYGLGKELEPNTYAEIPNRIFGGRGIAHFFTEPEVKTILEETGFKKSEVNFLFRSEKHQGELIKEWIVQAQT
ncbi:MAG: class I SAM-dependent methyltransferase [Deltaproteobacteria bacterium]|nr:class I SAM-dependent methyltransferase [Deltaproteobacteria bacterium]